jgi:arginyl-tRNA synthetase
MEYIVTLFDRFASHVDAALDQLVAKGQLPADLDRRNVTVEPPRDPAHGDLATNAAMVLAKPAGTNPRALAELLSVELAAVAGVTSVEIAGPGFLNLRLAPSEWLGELALIGQSGDDYGRSAVGRRARRSMSNMSLPTPPGRCIWGIVGVRW